MRPGRVCSVKGCPNLTPCAQHEAEARARERRFHDVDAGGISYGSRWKRLRADFLARHMLCVDCQAEGRVTRATEVDHEVPHRGDRELFWNQKNWTPRCKPHHSAKTAKESWFSGSNRGSGGR